MDVRSVGWSVGRIFELDIYDTHTHIHSWLLWQPEPYNSLIWGGLPQANKMACLGIQWTSTYSVVGQLNPCHRGRDVIGGVSSCFRRVSSVLIATTSRGGATWRVWRRKSRGGGTDVEVVRQSINWRMILMSIYLAESINNNWLQDASPMYPSSTA